MADHGYFEELICAELDGELSAGEAAELRAHLAGCERCRAFREAMGAVEGAAARHLPEPPAELMETVMAAVRAEAEAKNKKKKGKILAFPGRSLAVAAAATLVLWAGFRATDLFRPKGMTAAAPMMAAAESAEAARDEGIEEPMMAMDYAVAEEYAEAETEGDAPEAPAEAAGGLAFGTAPSENTDIKSMPAGQPLCRISDREGLLRTLPVSELPEGLLVPGEPCPDPDREPDYILEIYTPGDGTEEYRLWEQDGVMVLETDDGEFGCTVSAEALAALIN